MDSSISQLVGIPEAVNIEKVRWYVGEYRMIRLILRWISAALRILLLVPLLLLVEPRDEEDKDDDEDEDEEEGDEVGADTGEGDAVADARRCEIICCSSAKIS